MYVYVCVCIYIYIHHTYIPDHKSPSYGGGREHKITPPSYIYIYQPINILPIVGTKNTKHPTSPIYTHTHIYTHICTYMCIYVCVCVYICTHIHTTFICLLVCLAAQWCLSRFATPWTKPARLLCPWDSPGKNTGVGCHVLLQGIFLTQALNWGLLHCRRILYQLSYQGSPHMYTPAHRCPPYAGGWEHSDHPTPHVYTPHVYTSP